VNVNLVRKNMLLVLITFVITFFGCQSKPDFEKLRAEIIALHKTTIEAHWKKDINFFTKDISENYFSVGNGEIQKKTKKEITEQFTNYLNNTTFSEYRDLQEPIIGFSKDGSLAWSIVKVKIVGNRKMNDGAERELDFICVWITLYEKPGDTWIRLGEVSSFK